MDLTRGKRFFYTFLEKYERSERGFNILGKEME